MFRRKLRGYRVAAQVEANRAAAEQLRRESPQTYEQILNMAEGKAADAAAQDPDAFVALFLAAAEEQGVIGTSDAPWPEAPSEIAPFCNGTNRRPHTAIRTAPVEDPYEPTYRCPTCGREQRISETQSGASALERTRGRRSLERDRDADIRSAATQTEELIERVREELLEVEADAGQPLQYPDWAIRQFVKYMTIAEAAQDRLPTLVSAHNDPAPEKPKYEQALDRVLSEEGLTGVAEEVLAAVTISPEDWEALTEDERRRIPEWRSGDG